MLAVEPVAHGLVEGGVTLPDEARVAARGHVARPDVHEVRALAAARVHRLVEAVLLRVRVPEDVRRAGEDPALGPRAAREVLLHLGS